MRRTFLAKTAAACAIFGVVSCSRPEPSRPPQPPKAVQANEPVIKLLAVGDVNLARQCGQSILSHGPSYPFGHLRNWIESFDLAFCNLESNISEQHGETVKPDNRLIFTAPPLAALSLRQSGWDLISTANNHSSDYGLRALKETILRLEGVGLPFNGTALFASELYQPTFVRVKDLKIAFLAVTDVYNGPVAGTALERHINLADRDCLLPALQDAERLADFTILSYHGGNEYWDRPTSRTRNFVHWAIDHGADLIIGHHPHVIQAVETYRGSLIIYSLGNFTFYQGGNPYWTDYGLAASITIGRKGVQGAEFLPIRAHFQPRLVAEGVLRSKVLARLTDLSNGLGKPAGPSSGRPGIMYQEGSLAHGDN